MSDRELLALAAKAAGHSLVWGEVHRVGDTDVDCTDLAYVVSSDREESPAYWNPLEDDGDALRLAVKLGIGVKFGYCADDAPIVTCTADVLEHDIENCMAPDFRALTRRTIVQAAAEIAKAATSS